MLNIQLQLVHFIVSHTVGHFFQKRKLGHPSSCDIVIKTSVGDIRTVFYLYKGQDRAALLHHLLQGLAAVPDSRFPSGNPDIFRIHRQNIIFFSHLRALLQNHIALPAFPSCKSQGKPQLFFQRLLYKRRLPGEPVPAGGIQHDISLIRQDKSVLPFFRFLKFNFSGLWYEIHGFFSSYSNPLYFSVRSSIPYSLGVPFSLSI